MKLLLIICLITLSGYLFGQDADSCKVILPNSLTMNCHTGIDWQFKCESNCTPKTFEISIYNRWGQLRYESKDFEETWDASEEAQGIYMYSYKIVWPGGREEKKSGSINVIK